MSPRPRLAALAVVLASAWFGVSRGDETATPADDKTPTDAIEVESESDTVTGALQGKEGVRIQTMCTHCNSANVQVGGLNQDLVPIHRDGYPIFGGLATSFVLGVLPADNVAEAKVAKGPGQPSQPAAAAGGLIDLIGARPSELPLLDVSVDGGSYSRNREVVRVAGPMHRMLQGSVILGHEQADTIDDDGDGWNDVGAVDRDFAEAGLRIEPSKQHAIDLGASWIDEDSLDGRGAFDPQVYLQNLPPDPAQWPGPPAWTREDTLVERMEYRAGWRWKMQDRGVLSLRLLDSERDQSVVSQQTRDPASPFSAFVERLRITDDDRWGGVDYERPFGWSFVFRTGVEARDQEVEARTVDLIFNPGAAEKTVTDGVETKSAFAEADWGPSPRWRLLFGVRYDDLSWEAIDLDQTRSASYWSPRATVSFAPASGWTFRLIAGQTARPPSPIFAQVCCGQNYERNVNARSERGTTIGLEGVYQPSPALRVSAYAARSDFDDYLLRMVGSSFFFIQTYTLGNIPSAEAETAEIALRWTPVSRLTFNASIGWLSFFNRGDTNVPISVTPLFRSEPVLIPIPIGRIPYQPVRTGSISAALSLPRGVVLNASTSYTGTMLIQQFQEDPLTPRTVIGTAPDGTEVPVQTLLLDEMRETPGFWLVNFSLTVPLKHGLELFGGIDNVTDRIQNDLGDPTRDYNWGPLAGRSWRLGLTYRLDRKR